MVSPSYLRCSRLDADELRRSVNQYHQRTIPALTGMSMLAMSLIYDIGLNKPIPKETPFVMLNYTESGCPKKISRIPRTLEENRALLACFYLTSEYASAAESSMNTPADQL